MILTLNLIPTDFQPRLMRLQLIELSPAAVENPAMPFQTPHACRFLILLLLSVVSVQGCTAPRSARTAAAKPAVGSTATVQTVLLDFEKADAALTWIPLNSPPATTQAETLPALATSQPGSQPASPLRRIAQRPESGLWSMGIALTEPGEIRWTPTKILDLGAYDILTLQFAHLNAASDNGACTAQVILTDADGKTARGDAFAIKSKWAPVRFDLKKAFDDGLDISRIVSIGVALKPTRDITADAPLLVQTDTWAAGIDSRIYLGSPAGPDKSFYVQSRGDRIRIGSVGQYEMYIWNRGSGNSAGWLEAFGPAHEKRILGQEGTGLMLLDQSGLDALGTQRRQSAETTAASGPSAGPLPPIADFAWPANTAASLSAITWNVVWTSPVGAIIEGHQETGPYDHLGEPAVTIKWRLMVYQWGQVFVDAAWTKTGEGAVTQPVTWALALDSSTRLSPGLDASPTERLLADIYTPRFRQGMTTALPDRMQIDFPLGLIARTSPQKDTWWWAADDRRHVFGAGIPGTTASAAAGEASCMLLVNSPNALMKAGSFGQYLDPAKLVMRQGELERTYPGDADNDGFVESYGFHAIRLANGRATFTIYPQERPIFYPAFLFTIPAAERDAVDLKNSRLLINVDGKQFADPPVFPSGSFLLQLPYVLDRPVSVEAVLVRK